MKMLVVDDFSTMRKIARKMLSKLGFEDITEAVSGKDAWDKLQEQEFDFVLTDWNMPEMTGLELLVEIRKHEKLKELPVVLITAEAEKDNIANAISQAAKCLCGNSA